MTNKFYTNIRQWGDDLLYIGYDEDGRRVQKRIKYEPTLYIAQEDLNQHEDAKCYDGTLLKSVDFDSIKSAKEFISNYKDCSGFNLYGMDKFNYQYITQEYKGDVQYNRNLLRLQILDIEVDSTEGFPEPDEAKAEITCLTIKDVKNDTFHVWTNKNFGNFDANNLQYINKDEIKEINIIHHDLDDEEIMLRDFISWFSQNYPDILTGWYSRDFDIPYLYNRLENVLGKTKAKLLSPWSIVQTKKSNIKRFGQYQEKMTYEIYGYAELDYMDLYKKYTYTTSESFALDFIANKHLGVGKLKVDGVIEHKLLSRDPSRDVKISDDLKSDDLNELQRWSKVRNRIEDELRERSLL